MNKVTKHVLSYPTGYEPDYIIPAKYGKYRYALGKSGSDPLVVVCMNPSAAKEDFSDKTINRIISVSKILKRDGWVVFNLYPERATKSVCLGEYDDVVGKENLAVISDFIKKNHIKDVWGAWGNSNGIKTLEVAKNSLLKMLKDYGINIFYFGTLTKSQNPRHPLQRNEKVIFSESNKKYL